MDGSNIEKLRDELTRLMREHIDNMRKQTFLGISPEDVQVERQRLSRIREISAEFLEALKKISS